MYRKSEDPSKAGHNVRKPEKINKIAGTTLRTIFARIAFQISIGVMKISIKANIRMKPTLKKYTV